MSEAFDAYYTWLGIPPEESAGGVPNHYRLLGLTPFESNPSVIDHAADRVLIHLRTLSSGPQGAEAQRIIVARGDRLLKDGKPVDDAGTELDALRQTVRKITEKSVPLWQKLLPAAHPR